MNTGGVITNAVLETDDANDRRRQTTDICLSRAGERLIIV